MCIGHCSVNFMILKNIRIKNVNKFILIGKTKRYVNI